MNKIKAIQKGDGDSAIYFKINPNSYQQEQIKNGTKYPYIVDEIIQGFERKELVTDEYNNTKGQTAYLVYYGYKDGKLIFSMTGENLTIWYE